MRELVIKRLRNTKWYKDTQDEYEGYPYPLENCSDDELLGLYVKYGPY